jgi:hypothetical protein
MGEPIGRAIYPGPRDENRGYVPRLRRGAGNPRVIYPGEAKSRETETPAVDYVVRRRYSCGSLWGSVRTSSMMTKFASEYMWGR